MASTSDLKSGNIQTVRRCFYLNESLSVNEVKKMTGLSHGCTVNAFRALEESGEIGLLEKTGKTVGRKTHRYALNEEFGHFLAIDVRREHNGFSSRSWRMNLKGTETDVRIRSFAEMDDTYLHEEISSMMRAYPDTDMILISTPGICEEGVITNGEIFRMDIGSWIETEYHIPYVIENDVNVAAIGFSANYPHNADIAVIYQAENGIFGCGILINGRLYNGFSHAAGEVRYLPDMEEKKKMDPSLLLAEMIQSVSAILNPKIIGWASDCVHEEPSVSPSLPARHMPTLIHIHDLDNCRKRGLFSIGIYNISEESKG